MIRSLLYLTDDNDHRSHTKQVEEVCRAGAPWVQLRVKGKDYNEWLRIAETARQITRDYGAMLTINDNVRIAREVGADGVHLGRHDMSPVAARSMLKDSFHIGGTANTWEEVDQLVTQQVDYIGVGPFRDTDTKEGLRARLGIEGIKKILDKMNTLSRKTPIVAIGGVRASDAEELYDLGVSGVAVGGSVRRAVSLGDGISEVMRAQEIQIPMDYITSQNTHATLSGYE